MSELIVNDGPEDRCFGCGHSNPQGLRLSFRRTAQGAEAEYEVPEAYAGAPGVVHGGIQAALLDEVLGTAAHAAIGDPELDIVTVEMRLCYRRPARTGRPLCIRGRLVRVDGRDVFVEGEIAEPDGAVLTTAEARWRRIDRSDPARGGGS